MQQVRTQGEDMGLRLNVEKREYISLTPTSSDQTFNEFIHLKPKEATLLEAPLTIGSAMDNALSGRCTDLALAIERFKLFGCS